MNTRSEKLELPQRVKDVRFSSAPCERGSGSEPQPREQCGSEHNWRDAQKAEREQLARERAELLELQNGVLQALNRALPEMARQGEDALIALALQAVDKLVAGLPIGPEMIEATVREALQHVENGPVSVVLHPDDLALLQRVNSQLLPAQDGDARLQFRTSPDLTRGGCLVQTRFGVIDASRETKSALLKKSLLP